MTLTIVVISFFGLYILVDLGRLLKRRTPPAYRRRAFWLTLGWLLGLQVVTTGIYLLLKNSDVSSRAIFYGLAAGQLLCGLIGLITIQRQLKNTRLPAVSAGYSSQSLPTLSVCLPARNETDDLKACLESLVASDYPKLEILVLDDSSQNRRTPEIIRSFAQSGVRFLAGKEPPARWLAKNYAYQQLADAANGELLLFCGVDTRFAPQSLSILVKLLLQTNKTMISLLPRNQLPDPADTRSLLIQPSRYAWQLALPRRAVNHPPVLSTCWLIKQTVLTAAGGFAAVSHQIVPESYFARYAVTHDDGYGFKRASSEIGLTNAKSFNEQLSTAIRTRYPQLHRRPEATAVVSLAELYVLMLPVVFLLIALAKGWWSMVIISAVSCVLLSWQYVLVVRLTYRRLSWLTPFMLPLAALYDVGLLNYSLLKYEFGRVLWKGRDISRQIMGGSL